MTCTYCSLTTCCGDCDGVKMSEFAASSVIASTDRVALVRGSGGATSNVTVTVNQLKTYIGLQADITGISALPDGTIPMVSGGELVASSILEDADSVNFGLDIEVPGDSVAVGQGVTLKNKGQTLSVAQDTGGDYIVPKYLVDDTQAYKPKWPALGTEATENLQTNDATTMAAESISFLLNTVTENKAWRINAIRLRGAVAVSGVRMQLSKGSAPLPDGSNVIFDYPSYTEWLNGDGYSFSVGDFSIDAKGVFVDKNDSIYCKFSVVPGSGTQVSLKGDGTTPFIRIDRQIGTIEDVETITGYELTFADSPFTVPDECKKANIFVDATGGNVSITLPAPSLNLEYAVIKTDATANTVTVNASSIIGSPTLVLSSQYDAPVIVSSSSEYYLK